MNFVRLPFLLGLSVAAFGQIAPPVITTVAGTQPTFYDGLPALQTPLGDMGGLAFDAQNRLYVAVNNRVVRLESTNRFTVVAGNGILDYSGDGGPATSASLDDPHGLVFDRAGNLYIADTANMVIRKVSTDGTISTFAGNGNQEGPSGDGGPLLQATLSEPFGLAFDGNGNLYVSEAGAARVRRITPAGSISTIAGTGQAGYTGDGGQAASAELDTPGGLAWDSSKGYLYIADYGNERIRRVDSYGIVSTVVGNSQTTDLGNGGPGSAASIGNDDYIALDQKGQLYIGDEDNHVVRKLDANGIISDFAGTGISTFTGDGGQASLATIQNPGPLAVDATGNLYVADTVNHRIREIDTTGVINTIAGTGAAAPLNDNGPATNAFLSYPFSVAVDNKQNLYIADGGNYRIRKVAPDGTITTFAGDGKFVNYKDGGQAASTSLILPLGVATDNAGNVYISDAFLQTVRKVDPTGVITTVAGTPLSVGDSGDGGPATKAQLYFPTSIAVDAKGNLYITDTLNSKIKKVTPDGIIHTIAGIGRTAYTGDRGPGIDAALYYPFGVAVDAAGDVFIADTGNNAVRKVDTKGTITTIAGTSSDSGSTSDNIPATTAKLEAPTSLAFDSAGNLYIGEGNAARVREVNGQGIITTVAGMFEDTGATGDGGPATQARLSSPEGLAFDGAGNLFIADTGAGLVRKVVAGAVQLQASPNSISFNGIASGAPASATLNITGSVNGLAFSSNTDQPWLTVTPSNGVTPASLQVSADPANLSVGNYSGTITIAGQGSNSAPVSVKVSMQVGTGASPVVSLSTNALNFTFPQGGAPSSDEIQLTNAGSGTLAFSASPTTLLGGNWLSVTPASGSATPKTPATVTVTATPGQLPAGTYRGSILINSGPNSVTSVAVTMTIAVGTQKLLLSQTGVTFNAAQNGGTPLPQNFAILNVGKGTLPWTAEVSTFAGGNWISVSQQSGTVQRPFLDADSIQISVDQKGLAPGNYYGQVLIRAPGSDNVVNTVCVLLTVAPAGTPLPPEVRPAGIVFVGEAGTSPSSQTISIANLQQSSTSYASSRLTFDGAPWFIHAPANAGIDPSRPATIVVQPNFQNLTPSVLNGVITLQFADGTVNTVKVLSVVAAPGTLGGNVDKGERAASGCSPKNLVMALTDQPQNTSVIVGQPASLEVALLDNCGTPVSATGAVVAAAFSNGDPSVNMVHTTGARWNRTWQPQLGAAGSQVHISLTALQVKSDLSVLSAQLNTSINIQGDSNVPLVSPGGIVNAASFAANAPVAPGSIISVFGAKLSTGTAAASTVPLQTQLATTQVKLGDRALPMFYTSDGQINAQIPFDVPADTQLQLLVRRDNTQSVPATVNVASAGPGIFPKNGMGAIVNAVTGVLADNNAPLHSGDIMSIYCTGLGVVSPVVGAGQLAPSQEPLARTANTVTVTVGGVNAPVSYAGLAPGFIGLYQVNAAVPPGVASGSPVPVIVTVLGQASPAQNVSVH